MRWLTALAVALCLTVSGGAVAIDHGDPATPVLSAGKLKLADAAFGKPPLTKLRVSLSLEQPATTGAAAFVLPPLPPWMSALDVVDAAPAGVTPAALVSFSGHPTRAGP